MFTADIPAKQAKAERRRVDFFNFTPYNVVR